MHLATTLAINCNFPAGTLGRRCDTSAGRNGDEGRTARATTSNFEVATETWKLDVIADWRDTGLGAIQCHSTCFPDCSTDVTSHAGQLSMITAG